jgi:tRNA threonylcarbamoyladenosine biosynthesis protein TsaB
MTLLAFDTSAAACSVALWRDGATIAHASKIMERGHAETLMPMIEGTLGRAGVAFADLTAIAATVGPGSFTGIRIGLATARGLALALDAALVGVTTFEAVAHAARREMLGSPMPCLVVLDAKREDVYAQLFRAGGEPDGPPAAVMPEAAAALLPPARAAVAGDGARHVRALLAGRDVWFAPGAGVADAADVAALAAARIARAGSPDPADRPLPLYISPPGVTVRRRRAGAPA